MCNMGVEAGAKNAIVASDDETSRYLALRGIEDALRISGDANAN